MGDLKQKINQNTYEYQRLWYELPSTITKSLPSYDMNMKIKNEKYIETFINSIFQAFLDYPNSEVEKVAWGKNIYKLILDFGSHSEFINNKAISLLFSKDIKNITKQFFKRAKSFDNKMTFQEIGQAMRNVWIMNISQVLLNVEVRFTNTIFAYSMLYPYTDNILDDKTLTTDYKEKINIKLKNIIQGKKVEIENEYEKSLYELIEIINQDYDRSKYINVFESILAIHEAQGDSLSQQNKSLSPYEKDMLNISFIKGGTSVLADGYLVKGELTSQESKFMLAYGIMLQLCDDLQDVQEDLKNNNTTIFSLTAKHWDLENMTNKLINFIDHVIYVELKDFQYEIKEEMDAFLKQNCLILAFLSMSSSKKYYSKKYLHDIEKYLPFRFSFLKSMGDNFKKKSATIKKKFNEETFSEMIDYI